MYFLFGRAKFSDYTVSRVESKSEDVCLAVFICLFIAFSCSPCRTPTTQPILFNPPIFHVHSLADSQFSAIVCLPIPRQHLLFFTLIRFIRNKLRKPIFSFIAIRNVNQPLDVSASSNIKTQFFVLTIGSLPLRSFPYLMALLLPWTPIGHLFLKPFYDFIVFSKKLKLKVFQMKLIAIMQ